MHRKSTYQLMALERRDSRFLSLLEREHPTVRRMLTAHQQHESSMRTILSTLDRLGWRYQARTRITRRHKVDAFDLVVTVGGDGTFLAASHLVRKTPMLGVASSLASIGHFCGANARTFADVLETYARGELPVTELRRLEVEISGEPVLEPALNEVLVCHGNPAATSRYILSDGKTVEEQKSSGLWIATAAGSTAAIASAGGTVEPPTSRRFQYLVREPYLYDSRPYALTHGFIGAKGELTLTSKMEKGFVFLDGHHLRYPFFIGDSVKARVSPDPLKVFAMGGAANRGGDL